MLSEIVGSWNDASTKIMLPDPVDHDSSCQWILVTENPVGKLYSAAHVHMLGKFLPAKHRGEFSFGEIAEVVGSPFR